MNQNNKTSNFASRVVAAAFLLLTMAGGISAQEYMMPRSQREGKEKQAKENKVEPKVMVTSPRLMREANNQMAVDMNISFPNLRLRRPQAFVLIPMVVNGSDTLKLPAIGIYGRNALLSSRRNDRLPLSQSMEKVIRFEPGLPDIAYSQKVEYQDWMNGSDLIVELKDYGCAGCNEGIDWLDPLAHYQNVVYEPTFIYQTTVAQQVKTRELSGKAYIDFPVNKTEIYPDYRRNTIELHKIIATIDSVRNDPDVSVTSITIKGFASPEGSYSNNVRLAKGRTEALKNYVQSLYHFPAGFIKTDYEPEDWDGLREYVENSTMANRSELLRIINDTYLDPDTRDRTIATRFPSDYKFLLQNVYPALRHSDYTIEYEVRSFTDPVEIREMLVKDPGKLSMNEVYIAAQGLESGSPEYNEIFETAARLFPNEPLANLNAANALMQRGDLTGAERYLEKAGDSPEAIYARGVLAGLKKDYATAVSLVEKAMMMGANVDQQVLDNLREAAKYAY